MKKSTIVIYIILAILTLIAYFIDGVELVEKGFSISIRSAYTSMAMVFASFLLIGQINVLLTSDLVKSWMEKSDGFMAVVLSAFAGGLFPGGPYTYYPFLGTLKKKGVPIYTIVAFIFGKGFYSVANIPLEMSLISPKIAIIRFFITLPMPIMAGFFVYKVFEKEGNFILKSRNSDLR